MAESPSGFLAAIRVPATHLTIDGVRHDLIPLEGDYIRPRVEDTARKALEAALGFSGEADILAVNREQDAEPEATILIIRNCTEAVAQRLQALGGTLVPDDGSVV